MLPSTEKNPIRKRKPRQSASPKTLNGSKKAFTIPVGAGRELMVPEEVQEARTPRVIDTSTEEGLQEYTIKRVMAEFLAFRAMEPALSIRQAALRMGIHERTLSRYIHRAGAEGWLNFLDPLEEVEYGLIPKTIDNLNYFLDKKDRLVTVETAKGTIFRQYQESKGVTENNVTVLALKIEQSDGTEMKTFTGHIVGKPKQ